MIALLRGSVALIGEDSLVIDVQGVGYLVYCSSATLHRLPLLGLPVEMHTEMQVREDGITLFGFLEAADRGWFRLLQTVQGVGARVALAILGVLPPSQLAGAIASGDRAALTRASGVGAKLATRILTELKDRVASLPTGAPALPSLPLAAEAGPAGDALSALVNLGYGRSEAFAAVAKVQARLGEAARVDALIREGLKELTG